MHGCHCERTLSILVERNNLVKIASRSEPFGSFAMTLIINIIHNNIAHNIGKL